MTTALNDGTERRAEPRVAVSRAVKLRGEHGGPRYHAARTCNLSTGGTLLELDGTTALRPGARVRLGFARESGAAVLAADELIEGVVLRSGRQGAQQTLAVRFAAAQPLPLAG